jgi:hypothetical protein
MSEKRHLMQLQTFESIRQETDVGEPFWYARELAPLLDYQDYRNFLRVIDKARQACELSKQPVKDHFGDVTKMVDIGSGAQREPVTNRHGLSGKWGWQIASSLSVGARRSVVAFFATTGPVATVAKNATVDQASVVKQTFTTDLCGVGHAA